MKKYCQLKKVPFNSNTEGNELICEQSVIQLNRLESFLLKLVIPFLRVAHCPRGPYLKVKGDLILISSNLEHSLSQILPLEQNLIPVCFKRKLAYSGAFIEEVVERKKIQMIFEWLKQNNHLFRKIEFDFDRIQQFIEVSVKSTEIEGNTTLNKEELDIPDNEDNQRV